MDTSNAKAGEPGGKRSLAYPKAVDTLIAELASLPGIGRRSAERLAFYLLKSDTPTALRLASAIHGVKTAVTHCKTCWNLSDAGTCPICADPTRDRSTILVVEQPKDAIALEQTSMYRGLYHVLMGRLSPLDGVGPDELTFDALLRRVKSPDRNPGNVRPAEIILGLNPTIEGDGTALYLIELLKPLGVKVSRLARGLPSGSTLEQANKAVLADAIAGRQGIG
jgi:recombination protein RecR